MISLLKTNKAFSNIPSSLIANYTYLGKLYALPHQAHYSGVVLNLDAFDELNMDIPSLSWNMKELENVLKTGTTDKFSGCEYLGAVLRKRQAALLPMAVLTGIMSRPKNLKWLQATVRRSN